MVEAHRAFWTHWLLALGGIGLLILLVSFWDDIVEAIESLVLCFQKDDLDDDDEYYRKSRRKRKRVKWRVFVPFLSYRRRQWLAKRNNRHTNRMCKDAVAETIATHEDILDAMYGKSASMGEIYRRVKDQYRR